MQKHDVSSSPEIVEAFVVNLDEQYICSQYQFDELANEYNIPMKTRPGVILII